MNPIIIPVNPGESTEISPGDLHEHGGFRRDVSAARHAQGGDQDFGQRCWVKREGNAGNVGGKPMEKPYGNGGKTHQKPHGNGGKPIKNALENPWTMIGRSMETHWKLTGEAGRKWFKTRASKDKAKPFVARSESH